MSVFATASRLASWAAVCPGNHESAGQSKSGATRKDLQWLGIYLHDAANRADRGRGTKDCSLTLSSAAVLDGCILLR